MHRADMDELTYRTLFSLVAGPHRLSKRLAAIGSCAKQYLCDPVSSEILVFVHVCCSS
jgi:hypothetical protein